MSKSITPILAAVEKTVAQLDRGVPICQRLGVQMKSRHLAATAALCLALTAHADEWTGRDKEIHFIGGAAVAAAVTAATGNEWHGLLAGTGVGLAKELYDATGRGTVSGKDFVVTAVGALVGAKLTGWTLGPNRVTYTMTLNIF